ncbi:sentrin-specific protease 8 [Heterostelium album PN500]|uniref:Sentrin-specific protease 8 n=1 Tax=Heterostelium pallidum (strain ATCC 26659 / Pp 5 / PN500) TaxID=670386 RepID=D3BB70_HETP5|nr:sentrin-specific protease 8 [Heterostelium album PN500]EFA81807.1 sentrin-specific protease 8 [Heterostelium album PN500]|eukprot:XP_020433924.1 sentrin-specific protease 8 [Heterostelium album PN500]
MSDDPIILSFKDASLYKSDLSILKNRYQWLNDAIISFYFEYLSDTLLKDYLEKITLMSASTVFMLNYVNGDDVAELNSMIGALDLPSKEIIFIPINNNEDPDQIAGGSHWSLLVYEKVNQSFYYYDSISGDSNYAYGCVIARKLYKLLTGQQYTSSKISKRNTPQQRNGFDCGMYLLSITENLSQQLIENYKQNNQQPLKITSDIESSMYKTITPDYISIKRNQIYEIVEKLINK